MTHFRQTLKHVSQPAPFDPEPKLNLAWAIARSLSQTQTHDKASSKVGSSQALFIALSIFIKPP
ncbi:hypothetical protein GW931_04175 [archaeon]|nr:hypothetical protein [archaeon]